MFKIQKALKLVKSDFGFLAIVFIVVALLFVSLSPKISSELFAFKRQAVLNDFLNNTKTSGKIDPQKYWEFREFYSPGSFVFSRLGLPEDIISYLDKKLNVTYNKNAIDDYFLYFSTFRLSSLDMLTKKTSLNLLIDSNNLNSRDIIFKNDNSVIYKKDKQDLVIIFLLSNSDMQKANGFFDYKDKDKAITQGENWFNITIVKVDN